jgi:hypothetical protein
MTKARDLANASTALSAVTATELGYVDGVTSAIQTQLDSKAATANTVSTAGGSTITVASGTTVPLTIQNNGTGNSLVVNDVASDTTPFIVDASGGTAINTTISGPPKLQVGGTTAVGDYPWDAATAALRDARAMAAGVGGGVIFEGNYLTGGGNAAFGGIRGNKTTSTSGAANGDLHYWSRQGAHKWYTSEQVLGSEGTPALQINSSNNLGVGKTPTTKLDVDGTVNATAFTVGGAALPSSAMVLISRVSIGNTASVTLDNVFTSAYTNYLLVIDNWFALGSTDDLLIRYRTGGSSGTDASTNHYSGSTSNQFQGVTWVNYNVTTSAAFPLVTSSDTTNGVQAALHFNNIGYASTYGHVFGNGINGSNQTYFNFMGYNAAGATYTGLRFNSTSSNIYLKASLYGLANS